MCPVRDQCQRHRQWKKTARGGEVRPKCISKCPGGKWFTRDEKSVRRVAIHDNSC